MLASLTGIIAKKKDPMSDERAFTSQWTQDTPYWIAVACATGSPLAAALSKAGMKELSNGSAGYVGVKADREWAKTWEKVAAVLTSQGDGVKAALIPGEHLPSAQEISFQLRNWGEIQEIASNLWLAQYLSEGRLVCFMQRVVDKRGKHVGYEAFARIETPGGEIIGGGAIMQASRALKVEYQLDRLMHRQAIQSYVDSDLEGYIFINFLTGFIQRPEVYLEGLSQAVDHYKITPRNIALDVPVTDPRDFPKLKTIANYCRTRGFALALDDIMHTDGLASSLDEIRPAFVKLDFKLGRDMLDPKRSGNVMNIIRLAHESGSTVLAEGVEDEKLYQAYVAAEVDMFQGYHFGAPEQCPPKKRKAS